MTREIMIAATRIITIGAARGAQLVLLFCGLPPGGVYSSKFPPTQSSVKEDDVSIGITNKNPYEQALVVAFKHDEHEVSVEEKAAFMTCVWRALQSLVNDRSL